jgi:hypothetical protein
MSDMKISKEEMIRHMLAGTWHSWCATAYPGFQDSRVLLRILRSDIISYLSSHPDDCENYFQKIASQNIQHDRTTLFRRDGKYVIAHMDHGNARWPEEFATCEEAVSLHLCYEHGLGRGETYVD